MTRGVIITGIGCLSPLGPNKEAILSAMHDQASVVRQSWSSARAAAFDPPVTVSDRQLRRMDSFAAFAFACVDMALNDRRLDLTSLDPTRIGVFIANCFGGWTIVDEEIRTLHARELREIGVHQALAWCPASAQMQITAMLSCRGEGGTFSGDRLSGLMALGCAAQAIRDGRLDLAIAGAAEALQAPYVAQLLELKKRRSVIDHPFADTRAFVAAEGAAFLVLEERDHALRHAAKAYCSVDGFSSGFCASTARLDEHIARIAAASLDATRSRRGLRLVLLDGIAEAEQAGIADLYQDSHFVKTKPILGNMFAVSPVMDAALASLALAGEPVPLFSRGEELRAAAIHASADQGGFAALQLVQ